ncbi:MAG: hypothetical protein ACR2HG_06715 [Pyrinomonadaceae bacterium]
MKNLKMLFFAITVFSAIAFFGSVKSVYAQRSSFEWSGTVDDTVQIRIRNHRARTRTLNGRAYYDERYNFYGRAPRYDANVNVRKRDGRGKVFVVQQPSRRNGYTTIIQVVDTKGGSDRYRFTVNWN